jgi:UDP-glucose 4-epimerase
VRSAVADPEVGLGLHQDEGALAPVGEAVDEAAAEEVAGDLLRRPPVERGGERAGHGLLFSPAMSDENRLPVLVTGGAGFIGSHVTDTFLAQGHRVVVLDDLSTGDTARVPDDARFVNGDIRDVDLEALFREERIGVVIHHAAQIDVRKSVADPVFDAEVNVLGTIRIVQAAVQAGVSQVVFASSGGAIYGDPVGYSADEDHPTNPYSPYGVAKLAGEKYLEALARDTPLSVTVLRYANVYGPRQDGRGEAGVIGIWMNRLLSGEDAAIFGDGEQTRDFVHVADVVAANRVAVAKRVAGVFNIGSGVETSVNALYRLVADACDVEEPARYEPGKPGEQRRSVLDPTRAREVLGWAASVPLPEGLRATADWFRVRRKEAPVAG